MWDSVVLATPSASVAKRRFLSRTARYSGLLNILEFAEADVTNPDQMQGILQGANAWVAFNVQQYLVPDLSHAAANAGVKRVIMTTPLPAVQCGEGGTHNLPEFIAARELFAAQGGSFTGIRHGEIVPGSEDNPYIIVNASVPVVMERVERGVLARAVGEMLRMTVTFNQDCGISSCNKFSSMYLDILRKTGLTRREEVFKMFQSGLIDLAQRLLNDMEGNVQVATKPIDDKEDSEEFLLEMRKFRAISMLKDSDDDLTEEQKEMKTLYGDTEDDKQLIEKRTQQILENAYQFYSTNKLTESTASWVFVDKNYEKAKALAKKEIYAARAEKSMRSLRRTSQAVSIDRVIDAQEKQYARLLSLERKEMLIQVEMWEIWVKYFSMLIPITAKYCKDNSISFSKLPEFEQSVLVMTLCNRLRETVGLPEYDNIYDATDAREIVERTSAMPKGEELNSMDAREAAASLLDQYGNAFTFPIVSSNISCAYSLHLYSMSALLLRIFVYAIEGARICD
ncbi:hypothetical protein EON65_31495 [archaeon]|nr:MAG: hypothetical protein EON65_31495 [archaeon]